jgi:hypothetical protein
MNLNRALFLTCLLILSSCLATFDLIDVQKRFNAAFHSDVPAAGSNSTAHTGYQDVADSLTVENIHKLDAKLQANAWMMRGISQWRIGNLIAASESAEQGLNANPVRHSRDQILLTMLPGLVIDAEVVGKWRAANKAYTATDYPKVDAPYVRALAALKNAENEFGAGTEQDVKSYVAYQKWRMLFNWQTIINNLVGGDAAVDEAIKTATSHYNGRDLLDIADDARNSMPQGDRLRAVIDAKTGR